MGGLIMKKLTAIQLRQFLNEIEADGNDLSLIEINFRHDEDSDVIPLGLVFEDLHDEDNNTLTSIVLQAQQLHQVQTNYMGFATGSYKYVDELNKLIGRNAFSCRATDVDPYPYKNWIVFGNDITTEEIERLNLRTDFIID
jgi:hypothetical protein